MTADATQNPPATPPDPGRKPRRRWMRWLLALFLLAGVLLIFHRPLLHWGLRQAVIQVAADAGLAVDFTLSGNLYHRLTITDLQAHAVRPDQPIRLLTAETIAVEYRLKALLTRNIPVLLESVEIRALELVADTTVLPPPPTPDPDASTADRPFELPPLPIPDRMILDPVNVRIQTAAGELLIDRFRFLLSHREPGFMAWDKIRLPDGFTFPPVEATTSRVPGQILLSDLEVVPTVTLRALHLNHHGLAQRMLALSMDWEIGDGEARIFAGLFADRRQVAFLFDATAQRLQPQRWLSDLSAAIGEDAAVEQLAVRLGGIAGQPDVWQGSIDLHATAQPRLLPAETTLQFAARLSNARFRIETARFSVGDTVLQAEGFADWNGDPRLLANWRGRCTLTVDDAGLDAWQTTIGLPLEGTVGLQIELNLADAALQVNNRLHWANPSIGALSADALRWGLAGTLPLDPFPAPDAIPVFSGELYGEMTALHYREYTADRLDFIAHTEDGGRTVLLDTLRLQRLQQSIAITGVLLPNDPAWDGQWSAALDWRVDLPDLTDFLADLPAAPAIARIQGALLGEGALAVTPSGLDGNVNLQGTRLGLGQFLTESLHIEAEWDPEKIQLTRLAWFIDPENSLQLEGSLTLGETRFFQSTGRVLLPNLALFKPLLDTLALPSQLEGSAELEIALEGDPSALESLRGDARLQLDRFTFAELSNARLTGDILIEDGRIQLREMEATALDFNVFLDMNIGLDALHLTRFRLERDGLLLANAVAYVPWQPGDDGWEIKRQSPLSIWVKAEQLDLDRLAAAFDFSLPFSGVLDLRLALDGPLEALAGSSTLRASGLRVAAYEKLQPADLDLDFTLYRDQARLFGTLRQPQVETVRIAASMPFSVPAVIETGALDPATPLTGTVQLPSTSLAFLTGLLPDLRTADGALSLDLALGGTLQDPTFSGELRLDGNAIRLRNPLIPLLTGLQARVRFTHESAIIDTFQGELAGGPFRIAGSLNFADLAAPTLDLTVVANEILVLRNDMVTLRTNADLRLSGPLQSAAVSGTIGLTKGRFFREIEILPLTLPGRPAPNQYAWDENLVLSFPAIADWTFDLQIRTDDPFLIRSNLARGVVDVDLRLGGTGLVPLLSGEAMIPQFDTTLPFSRLEFRDGLVTFTPDQPFNPIVNATGTSRIQDYLIRVNLSGRIPSPTIVFASDPPLPEEDIVSLIATGATVDDLQGGEGVLAGRAASLIFQQMVRRLFPQRRVQNEEMAEFLDRFDLQVGGLDPRTGEQAASLRYRISDSLLVIGDLDVEGQFRGQLKYLIRIK